MGEIELDLHCDPRDEQRKCVIECRDPRFPFHVEERDFFEGLLKLREFLEGQQVHLLCEGSRVNVWPSGMGRDMGLGRKAYVIEIGTPPSSLVDIFAPSPKVQYATVREQRCHVEAFYKSFNKSKDT